MIKKEYLKPTMHVVKIQQAKMLCGSLTGVKSSGLDDEDDLEYDDTSGNQGYAW